MSNILLNPGPTNTSKEVKNAQTKYSDVCHRTDEFINILKETKRNILLRFSADISFDEWEIAIFGGSGTAAMEALISSLLSDCQTIVAGKYGQRASDMMSVYGIKNHNILCNNINDLKSSSEKANLYFVENETTTGEKFNLGSIIEKFPNHRLYVDATSAFGATDYKKYISNIDAISFCSNKCLQSTPGLGIVIWRKDLKIYNRSYYLNLAKYVNNSLPFTLPVQSIAALSEALVSSAMTESDYNRRRDKLIKDFKSIGIECVNKEPSNSIIGFKHPNKSYQQLKNTLNGDKIVIYEGIPNMENSFRVSTMSSIFEKEYEYIIGCFRDTCVC